REDQREERYVDPYAETIEDQRPGQVVRSKEHPATPMSVDDALSEMELVGHDFYLFINEETQRPSVVYRRHAFDYGLISLTEDPEA
ncbi:sigma 54 modulation/S30EA ribosomal C-terminal domain-containing protein, partial [Corynebacterium casei]